jgi:hypothetical protein
MKTHTKTPLCCNRCWKPLLCPCGQPIYLDDVGTQLGKKGGLMRAKKTTLTERQAWGLKGQQKRMENFKAKKLKANDPL